MGGIIALGPWGILWHLPQNPFSWLANDAPRLELITL